VSRLRWSKMWWSDWAGDNALSLCSLAAQGLWMRLLAVAAQNEPYGSILVGGRQPSDEDLANLMRPPLDVRRFRRLLAELERRHVAKRDADGTLFSSRMRADYRQSDSQSRKAKIGISKGYGFSGSGQNQKKKKKKNPPPKSPKVIDLNQHRKASGWADIATDLAASGGEE